MSSEHSQAPLPDFLIIGAQKSGTSWLAHLLRQHPEVYMPEGEPHFFDKVHNYRKGEEWYRAHFTEATSQQIVGEKTPDYIWANGDGVEGHDPDVHENVHDVLPGAKLIVLLRDPVDRAVSAAKHIIRSGRVSPRHSLDDLLVGDKHELIAGHGVLEYGYYHRHLTAYLDLFSPSQILPLFFEEAVVDAPREGFEEVVRFLNLSGTRGVEGVEKKVNAHRASLLELYTKYYAPRLLGLAHRLRPVFSQQIASPSTETIVRLYDHYAEHNRRLAELMDRPLPKSWAAPDAVPASA
jgi:hypothetical protein